MARAVIESQHPGAWLDKQMLRRIRDYGTQGLVPAEGLEPPTS